MAPASAPPLTHDEVAAWLRLALTPRVGNTTARRLLAHFGSPEHIFTQSAAALQACASAAQVTHLQQLPPHWEAALQATWAWLQPSATGLGRALVTLGDVRYPPQLLHMEDPPLMLYALGPADRLAAALPLVDSARSLAVVGSRNPTAQGAENARQFAHHLASQGWCVVSGMALGIDAAAHAGALAGAGPLLRDADGLTPLRTVAVVGTGADRIYPRANQALAHQIVRCGVILSEYPLGTPPIATNFPKRNRLIAGLSAGTLVVEAALASGSLVTARLASEQGREVFAIPGSIHAPQSKGCHALLRQGAKLVESAQDILEELPGGLTTTAPAAAAAAPAPRASAPSTTPATEPVTAPATAPAHPVLHALGYDPMGFDQLQAQTGWETAALQAWLLEHELDGVVARLPGGLFQRMIRA